MAWMKVHQELAKHRKIFILCRLINCERRYAVGLLFDLWSWALDNADANGFLPEMTETDIASALELTARKGGTVVAAFIDAGWIDRIPEGLAIHDWAEYSGKLTETRTANRLRMRDARSQHVQNTGNAQIENSVNLCGERSIAKSKSKNKSKDNTPYSPSLRDELFGIFYAAYPNKVAKQAAEKAFRKIDPDEDLLAEMMEALERQKASEQWRKENGKYIPYPSTWLNQRRWEDEAQDADAIDPFFEGVII